MAVAGMLMWSLVDTRASYDAMLAHNEVEHQDRARVVQVTLKKQVQEWKDLLIRGHDHDNFVKYAKGFHDDQALVRRLATGLLADVKRRRLEDLVGGSGATGHVGQETLASRADGPPRRFPTTRAA